MIDFKLSLYVAYILCHSFYKSTFSTKITQSSCVRPCIHVCNLTIASTYNYYSEIGFIMHTQVNFYISLRGFTE